MILFNPHFRFRRKVNFLSRRQRRRYTQSQSRYVRVWHNTSSAAVAELEAMLADGVLIEDGGLDEGYARLASNDRDLAQKYGLIEESEFWNDEGREFP